MTRNHYEPRFEYVRLHIPTHSVALCDTRDTQLLPMTRTQFLTLLSRWNAQQPGVWQYWEAPR